MQKQKYIFMRNAFLSLAGHPSVFVQEKTST